MFSKGGEAGLPEKNEELGGEYMLKIPFDGPPMEGKRAIVTTTAGMYKGIVMRFDREGLDLAINGTVKQFDEQELRTIAAA